MDRLECMKTVGIIDSLWEYVNELDTLLDEVEAGISEKELLDMLVIIKTLIIDNVIELQEMVGIENLDIAKTDLKRYFDKRRAELDASA